MVDSDSPRASSRPAQKRSQISVKGQGFNQSLMRIPRQFVDNAIDKHLGIAKQH